MIEGQCLDLEFEGRTDITTNEYLHMIACKTGALIRCGLETGAMLADGDEATVRAFAQFGEGLGRAFQIRDDYLGIWGDEATLGKATGNDIRRRKKSYPVVFALERAGGAALDAMQRIYSQDRAGRRRRPKGAGNPGRSGRAGKRPGANRICGQPRPGSPGPGLAARLGPGRGRRTG